MLVKVIIQRYDPKVTEPPLKLITLGETEIEETEDDYLGEERYQRLAGACRAKGFRFKSYSFSSEEGYKYAATVF